MSDRALIVGAGIGGLAAAIALRRRGFAVTVYERSPAPRELGFALLLAPNAMRALRRLDLAEAVIERGVVARSGEIRRGDGRVLKRFDMTPLRAALGEDTVCALRPALHGTLLEALPAEVLALGTAATGFAQDAGGVTLELASGVRVRGALLVGADGIGSLMRQALHGDTPPRTTGLLAWRGVARGVSQLLGSMSGAQYLARGIEAGTAKASVDAVYWYVSAKARPEDLDGDRKRAVLARLAGFDPRFVALVQATAAEDIRRDALVDRPPLARWGEGRVTLLGDAAHPMTPHAGQGAAQALEDAVALGELLVPGGDVAAALRAYEAARIPPTTKIVALARSNARFGSIESRWGCALRDLAVRLAPERTLLARAIVAARS